MMLPDPLHPAVVHFPIVLLLVGAGVMVVAVFLRRWNLDWIAAVLLLMGAAGAWAAVETGEASRELLGRLSGEALGLIDSHQEWGQKTGVVAIIAAMLAVLAALTRSIPKAWARPFGGGMSPAMQHGFRVIAAIAALVSCYFVYQTARRGGEAVYGHGVGVNASQT
ncbi:MAG: DUF2231 domain-containing protein [Chthoniobacteraceae bacterium]